MKLVFGNLSCRSLDVTRLLLVIPSDVSQSSLSKLAVDFDYKDEAVCRRFWPLGFSTSFHTMMGSSSAYLGSRHRGEPRNMSIAPVCPYPSGRMFSRASFSSVH